MISLLPLKPAVQETVKVLDVVLDISRLCGGCGLTVGLNRKYKDKNDLLQHFYILKFKSISSHSVNSY